MKAILIDPWERSLETIDLLAGTGREALEQLYELVGERALDEARIGPGEVILVGDNSALANPRLPAYRIDGCKWPLYGRGVLVGHHRDGRERDTMLSVDELSVMIEFE